MLKGNATGAAKANGAVTHRLRGATGGNVVSINTPR
jgi:hypothetical protein